MKISRVVSIVAAAAALGSGMAVAAEPAAHAASIARGKYIVQTGGCNDCHTAHYPQAEGKVPESEWLAGSPVGFMGPWGTTFPANLRLSMHKLTEAQWMAQARAARRPPMPWFNLRDMSDDDLLAIYRYARSLGPTGEPAPAYVPPGQIPASPYIVFEPQNLPVKSAGGNVGR
jgi:mono/diheme cytochrome c family protein